MGGEGSMISAIKTLKMNRALLKKRKIKNLSDIHSETDTVTELEFKHVAEEELRAIKADIQERADREQRSSLRLLAILVFILLLIAGWIAVLSYGMERLNF